MNKDAAEQIRFGLEGLGYGIGLMGLWIGLGLAVYGVVTGL